MTTSSESLIPDNGEQQTAPTVFVSYSHDTKEHKAWVASLAQRLVDIRSLLQMTHVISMSVEVRGRLIGLLEVPGISDFPANHGVLYHREQRDKRVATRQPRTEMKQSKAVCWSLQPQGVLPCPMPEPGIYRLNIQSRGTDGEPHFQVVPRYLMSPQNG